MAEQAKITSIDALEVLRSSIIVFLEKAHNSIDQVGDDVRRTRAWLQTEQRTLWEREVRRRERLLGEAKQELMQARLSGLRERTISQEEAVRRAKRFLDEAEEKVQIVKKWTRDYDHKVDPLAKRLQTLSQILDHDMPRALAFLVHAQRTLDAYSGLGSNTMSPPVPTGDDSNLGNDSAQSQTTELS